MNDINSKWIYEQTCLKIDNIQREIGKRPPDNIICSINELFNNLCEFTDELIEELKADGRAPRDIALAALDRTTAEIITKMKLNHSWEYSIEYARATDYDKDNDWTNLEAIRALRAKGFDNCFIRNDSIIEALSTGCGLIAANRFAFLIESDPSMHDALKWANVFENAYNASKSEGHSEVYAHVYAEKMSSDNCKQYSRHFAEALEWTANNKQNFDPYLFAEKFSSLMIDAIFHGEIEDETDRFYIWTQAIAFSEGTRRYGRDKRKVELFENLYLNSVIDLPFSPHVNHQVSDSIALKIQP